MNKQIEEDYKYKKLVYKLKEEVRKNLREKQLAK